MKAFFIISIVGGVFKFSYSLSEDDVDYLDIVALVYSILVFIVAIVYYYDTGIDPLAVL